MVRKHTTSSLVLAVLLVISMLAGCTGQTVTPTSAPTATNTVPIVTETVPAATDTLEPTVAATDTVEPAAGATNTIEPTVAVTQTAEPPADGNYSLTILHTNDVHAHHEPNSDGDGAAAAVSEGGTELAFTVGVIARGIVEIDACIVGAVQDRNSLLQGRALNGQGAEGGTRDLEVGLAEARVGHCFLCVHGGYRYKMRRKFQFL